MQKGETKALLCTDVNRSSHGPGPPTCYLQTPWATGSHALQLCNECALGLPRSRRAARGSLLVLFFFFFLPTSQFLQLGPQAGTPHRKLPLGGLWGRGRGRGAAAPGRSQGHGRREPRSGVGGGSREERAGGARREGVPHAPTHTPREGHPLPSRPRAASAARRVHDTQTDPDRKRPVFSDDGCVFRVAAGALGARLPGVPRGTHFPACLAVPRALPGGGSAPGSLCGSHVGPRRAEGGRGEVCVRVFLSLHQS